MALRDYMSREEYNSWMRNHYKECKAEQKVWCLSLLGGKCRNCGAREKLEFDHIDPKTKCFEIGTALGRFSDEKIKSELTKCQLLCKPCHQEKTGYAKCGTRSAYTAGCRCPACTEANTTYYRKKRTVVA